MCCIAASTRSVSVSMEAVNASPVIHPVTLKVELKTHRSKPTHRRYFESDEAHEEHCRKVERQQRANGTHTLTYPTPISQWTGGDLDRLIADVIGLLDRLPLRPENEAMRKRRPHRAQVAISRTTSWRGHMPTRNSIYVESALSPHHATIELPEPLPAIALTAILDIHTQCNATFDLRSYVP
jgi:hypothetical protein